MQGAKAKKGAKWSDEDHEYMMSCLNHNGNGDWEAIARVSTPLITPSAHKSQP